ncbi:MAG: AraC family transcriptional regulator [Lachnospiraceae bacterium]|nr:AraC family transcriptional regulator [Lachnospiraceae bacterium]
MQTNSKLTFSKQGKRRKDIDHIIIEKGKRGDFSPLQPDHYHNFYEIFYLLSGRCHFLLKDTVYELEKGDLVFIAPGELHHSLYNEGENCEICMIYFKKEHLLVDGKDSPQSFMGSVPALYRDNFMSLLSRMLSEYAHIDEYSDSFLTVHLQELILMLMRHSVLDEKEPALLHSKDADILLATKYIYKNFKQHMTLEEVSNVASLSPTYFSKKFKQTTGMGFKEYLNFVRLKHAQAALLTTDSTITEIALEYGFNDSNYFKDLFKKVYGKSPREFRKNPD